MTISRHKDLPPRTGAGGHCRQEPGGAPIDQEPGLLCPEYPGRIFLGFLQDPLCMVEIVKSCDLCNVFFPGICQIGSHCLSFMTGHMKRIRLPSSVLI